MPLTLEERVKLPWLNFSQPQHTNAGKLLGDIYYRSKILDMFDRTETWGYPHNGGEHSLELRINREELDILIEAIQEKFIGHPGLSYFLTEVESEWRKKHVSKI